MSVPLSLEQLSYFSLVVVGVVSACRDQDEGGGGGGGGEGGGWHLGLGDCKRPVLWQCHGNEPEQKRRTETQSGAPEAVTNLDVTHCMPGILLETFSSQETHWKVLMHKKKEKKKKKGEERRRRRQKLLLLAAYSQQLVSNRTPYFCRCTVFVKQRFLIKPA